MITAILIEDELNARASLRKMLHIIEPDIKIVAETGFIKEAIDSIHQLKPQFVFIDIELEDGTGFDILKQLNNVNPKIIFTTAYNQYAIQAFKYSAIDYLLKPIDPEDLTKAISRAKADLHKEQQHKETLAVLKNNLEAKEKNIILKTNENQYVIPVKHIIRLQADASYTTFTTINRKIVVSKNLKFYQDLLGNNFMRCHQSHLVNSTHIKSLQKSEFIEMSNQELVPISTRKKTEITKIINNL